MNLKETKLSSFPLNCQLDKKQHIYVLPIQPKFVLKIPFSLQSSHNNVGALFQQQMIWLFPS
jgi:hypothetical protein